MSLFWILVFLKHSILGGDNYYMALSDSSSWGNVPCSYENIYIACYSDDYGIQYPIQFSTAILNNIHLYIDGTNLKLSPGTGNEISVYFANNIVIESNAFDLQMTIYNKVKYLYYHTTSSFNLDDGNVNGVGMIALYIPDVDNAPDVRDCNIFIKIDGGFYYSRYYDNIDPLFVLGNNSDNMNTAGNLNFSHIDNLNINIDISGGYFVTISGNQKYPIKLIDGMQAPPYGNRGNKTIVFFNGPNGGIGTVDPKLKNFNIYLTIPRLDPDYHYLMNVLSISRQQFDAISEKTKIVIDFKKRTDGVDIELEEGYTGNTVTIYLKDVPESLKSKYTTSDFILI